MLTQAVKKITHCLFFLPVFGMVGVFAQEYAGDELPLTHPFYQPYSGDVYVQLDAGYEQKSTKIQIPSQSITVSGFSTTIADASEDTATKSFFSNASVKFGLIDRLVAGVSGKYMFKREISDSGTGLLAASATSSSATSGFYEPALTLTSRWAGLRKEETYVDIEVGFRPGIQNSNYPAFTIPNNNFSSRIGIGSETGALSYGALLTLLYWQNSSADTQSRYNDRVIGGGLLFVQWDLSLLYFRLSGGGFKFLDANSNSTSYLKLFRPQGVFEIGVPVSDDILISSQVSVTFPNKGDLPQASIATGTISDAATIAATLSLSTKF